MVGRLVLLLVVTLVSCTGLPLVVPAATGAQASAQVEISKPSAIPDADGERARPAKRAQPADPPARPWLARRAWPGLAPRVVVGSAERELALLAAKKGRLEPRAHDGRVDVRRIRVTAHVPRMGDDDPPAA